MDPAPLGRCKELYRTRWDSYRVLVDERYQVQEITCLTRSGTTAYSRNKHVVGGGGGVLLYVRMNIHYNQIVSKGDLTVAISFFWLGSHLQKVFNIYYVRNASG